MRGRLIMNGFVDTPKFNRLREFIFGSATKYGIELEYFPTTALAYALGDDFFANGDRPDFILFWDKDVNLCSRLESTGVPVFNSAGAILSCDSKNLTAIALDGVVPMPKTILVPKTFDGVGYTDFSFLDKAIEILGLPLVVKGAYGSFGYNVYLAQTREQAVRILENLGSRDCLLQQFISESFGRDVRINIVGGREVSSMLRHNESDFRSNITNGGKSSPYSPSPEQIDVAVRACEKLGLHFAGVDVLFGKDGPIVCEVNSNPHYVSTYECTGVNVGDFIFEHIVNTVRK